MKDYILGLEFKMPDGAQRQVPVMWNHDGLPIGKADIVDIPGGGYSAQITFVEGFPYSATQVAEWIHAATHQLDPGYVVTRERRDGDQRTILEAEVLEVSICPIPPPGP